MLDLKFIGMIIVFVLAAFCCGIVVGHSIQPSAAAADVNDGNAVPVPVYNMTYNNSTVNVPRGTEFIVSLPENGASTGYTWDPTSSNGLDLVEVQYLPPNTDLIGAPGLREFHFKASRAGSQGVKMTLRRSWEDLTGTEEVFVLHINVS